MADLMTGMKRTHYCGEVSAADAGKEVVVGGFTNKQRDKGELVFIDLRDRTGIVQLVFDDTTDRAVMAKAKEARSEYVLMARGVVRMREAPNPEIPTGYVEITLPNCGFWRVLRHRLSISPMAVIPMRNCVCGTVILTFAAENCSRISSNVPRSPRLRISSLQMKGLSRLIPR